MNEMCSDYMYATLAVFALGVVLRIGKMFYVNLKHGLHTAKVTAISPNLLRIQIPTKLEWHPGQHVFLRFLGLRLFESHPFSISSLSRTSGNETNSMEFLVSSQSKWGFTHSLLNRLEKAGGKTMELTVILDGPFGQEKKEWLAFDSVLLIAGGSGISKMLPVLLDLMITPESERRCQRVDLIWARRYQGARFIRVLTVLLMNWREQMIISRLHWRTLLPVGI